MTNTDNNFLNVFKDITSLMLFFLLLSACGSTGIGIIYVFRNDLFIKFDTFKLLVFACSISLPIFLIYAFIYSLKFKFTGEEKERVKTKKGHNLYIREIIADSCVVMTQFYITIPVFWFFKLSFRVFFIVQIILVLVFALFIAIMVKCYNKNSNENSNVRRLKLRIKI